MTQKPEYQFAKKYLVSRGITEKTIETNFFMPDMDLYGKKLQIEMLKRIRDEKNFNSVEDLKAALKQDKAFSERFIKDNYA